MDPLKIGLIEDVFGLIAGIIAMGCATGILITWIKRRPQKGAVSGDLGARLAEISERLNRLDGAVDTMAVEVERISEGQRFVSKLLAERPTGAAIPERARGSTTPH